MRKTIKIFLILFLVISLVGCGNESENKDVIESKTCRQQKDGYVQIHKFTATNDIIDKVELTIEFDNSLFGVESLDILTETQKAQIKTDMLKNLGLESDTYEGVEINVLITDEMVVNVKADLKTADQEILSKVGLDFSNTVMSLKTAVATYKNSGATCN